MLYRRRRVNKNYSLPTFYFLTLSIREATLLCSIGGLKNIKRIVPKIKLTVTQTGPESFFFCSEITKLIIYWQKSHVGSID